MKHIEVAYASDAFYKLYDLISDEGIDFGDTKALFDVSILMTHPNFNIIYQGHVDRKWSLEYAQAEWKWYLTAHPYISELGRIYGKVPEIWKRMADEKGKVNSNYGHQWSRNSQLNKVIEMLKKNPNTRQAAISIYDGKEIHEYDNDTPCTYAVQFTVVDDYLNMSVVMRSNDLWYGFCNDQYQFSNLQMLVAHKTGYEVGTYYHYAHNMHLYKDKLLKQK
jgi:thymidylate synthase